MSSSHSFPGFDSADLAAAVGLSHDVASASLGARLQRPVIIPLIGLPGAGKSVLAQFLVAELQVRRVCRDQIRRAMFPECAYTFPEKRAAFKALLVALEVNCALAESSVIDGMTFSKWADLEKTHEIGQKYGLVFAPIFLDIAPQLAKQRIANEAESIAHPAADRDPDIVDAVLRRFERPPPFIPVIDASQSINKVQELAMHIILNRSGSKKRPD